ncbi:hypothetical protein WJX72_002528 [[Myrmecia] bisecta]|uniref:Uncharacterized protein n=1 Tax=[Myrmecia] bisecta TaxID=41462 RepID=A0AAW1PFH0_9CHLO
MDPQAELRQPSPASSCPTGRRGSAGWAIRSIKAGETRNRRCGNPTEFPPGPVAIPRWKGAGAHRRRRMTMRAWSESPPRGRQGGEAALPWQCVDGPSRPTGGVPLGAAAAGAACMAALQPTLAGLGFLGMEAAQGQPPLAGGQLLGAFGVPPGGAHGGGTPLAPAPSAGAPPRQRHVGGRELASRY